MEQHNCEVQNEVKQWRDLVIESKSLDLAWAKGIKGKHVEFPQENGKIVWGVEVEIPLRFEEISGIYSEMVKKFAEESGFKVTDQQLKESIEANKKPVAFSVT